MRRILFLLFLLPLAVGCTRNGQVCIGDAVTDPESGCGCPEMIGSDIAPPYDTNGPPSYAAEAVAPGQGSSLYAPEPVRPAPGRSQPGGPVVFPH